jgi:hypothetical protein
MLSVESFVPEFRALSAKFPEVRAEKLIAMVQKLESEVSEKQKALGALE